MSVPNPRAALGLIFPCGIGRFFVLDIFASISASYHMLSAPEAPAPAAIQIIEAIAFQSGNTPGAQTRPAHAVKATRLMTRGFIKAKKSEGSARLKPEGPIPKLVKAASEDTASISVICEELATNARHQYPQYEEAY